MTEFIASFVVGLICIILGILNMRGNISSLHSYHRHRVSEADRIPFGRKVGLGTVIAGASIMLCSVLSFLSSYTEKVFLSLLGMIILGIGLVVGLGISFYAIIKYNKGIF